MLNRNELFFYQFIWIIGACRDGLDNLRVKMSAPDSAKLKSKLLATSRHVGLIPLTNMRLKRLKLHVHIPHTFLNSPESHQESFRSYWYINRQMRPWGLRWVIKVVGVEKNSDRATGVRIDLYHYTPSLIVHFRTSGAQFLGCLVSILWFMSC